MQSSGRVVVRQALRSVARTDICEAHSSAARRSIAVRRATAAQQGPSPVASTSQPRSFVQMRARQYSTTSGRRSDAGQEQQTDQDMPGYNVRLTPVAARDIESVQAWLRSALPALPFPDDVALQMITHESWDHGEAAGHNRRLAFLGRRAMKFYLNLFLAQRSNDSTLHTSDRVDELLQTSMLGDNVGRALNLAEVMRWTPAVNDGQIGAKETGLFKIRGVAVEALIGAIYHQHGAQAARNFFLARVLPNLTTFKVEEKEALKGAIEEEAQQAGRLEQAGGSGTSSLFSGASAIHAGTAKAGGSEQSSVAAFSDTPAIIPSHATNVRSAQPRQAARRRSAAPISAANVALEEHERGDGPRVGV